MHGARLRTPAVFDALLYVSPGHETNVFYKEQYSCTMALYDADGDASGDAAIYCKCAFSVYES